MSNPTIITAYHGSGTRISKFDYKFANLGNDQIGSGFYFTNSLKEAISYTKARMNETPKPGGEDNPTVHLVNLSFNKLLDAQQEQVFSASQIRKFLLRSPVLDETLENWGEVQIEGRVKVLTRAIGSYVLEIGDGPLINMLHQIANDFYPTHIEAFNRALQDVLGYDGFTTSVNDSVHYVALFPDQIEIVQMLDEQAANEFLAELLAIEETKPVRDKIK